MTKRFASIFPFVEAGRRPRHIGRLVANHDFARALVTYGRFDEFVFGNPSVSNLRTFADTVRSWGLPEDRLARVRFVSYVGLPSLLASEPVHAFHLGGWGWFMAGLHYVRARYACNPWPITSVTHSLTGREVVDHAVRLSHAQMAPYDAVFCTSHDGREAMRKLLAGGARIAQREFAGRLEHVPLGIDDSLLDAAGDRATARRRLRIAPEDVVLLVLGRVTPWQKMDLAPLIDTLGRRLLPEARRPVTLLLAGSAVPDDLALVKDTIVHAGVEGAVRVHPNFPAAQKADVLAAADILLSPVDNAQETFGLSLLEAMAAGLPVVASRYDGYKDLVDDGVDGFLVDTFVSPEDPMEEWFDLLDPNVAQLFQSQGVAVDMEQLAERALRLVHDERLRAAMGRAGRAKVEREYRWSRVIERYEECWDRLARDAQAAGIVRPSDADNPYNIASARMFAHYATRELRADECETSVDRASALAPYGEIQDVVNPDGRPKDGVPGAAGYAATWALKYGKSRRAMGDGMPSEGGR